LAAAATPWSARARAYFIVVLVSAKVDVCETAPGMFGTQ
jgi:hypothetical protein